MRGCYKLNTDGSLVGNSSKVGERVFIHDYKGELDCRPFQHISSVTSVKVELCAPGMFLHTMNSSSMKHVFQERKKCTNALA
ncbi:hypothetical protein ES332_D01G145500v1 [Gossypium tomentosum]|uniref:Uncharacterized protein n=1 Tax=Gossypium tomentosum TaxID=34277 RepID=A0A5D2M902_GOSTO|nr:hypothetical protein ES332_D01G145500v1 [Gossypium tomentosum]